MFCRNCGAEVDPKAEICVKCGFQKGKGTKYCGNCGKETGAEQAVCLSCGHSLRGKSSTFTASDGGFTRVAEGKIISGVCTGLGRKWNISPWIIRAILFFLPFWPLWVVVYIVLSAKFPIE